ncbi:diguanylate cyclase [Anoxybacterium hadale]|uniref:Diguanylate cyclase n=1 Tax=Anoxybacterium hadale TaxID=3408580 RepID=A0ACD1A6C2_9FIRM|nr:diguanylate cyclase [Clostridiales bacterium]
MNNVILSSLLFVSSTLLCILVFYGIRRREIQGVFYFSILMGVMIIHSVGYACELLSNSLTQMYLCIKIEYIGASFYPFLIVLFAREYTDERRFANKYLLNLLLVINTITLILVYTNAYHGFYYSSVGLDFSPGFPILALKKGFWYTVQVACLFFSILYSVIILSIKLKRSSGNYRRKVAFMLIGVMIPLITLMVYMSGYGPVYIDLTPFSYFIMSLFIIVGLLRYDILLLAPITHEMVFHSIEEAVLVVDQDDFLVNFNAASKVYFPSLEKIKIGQSVHLIEELGDYDFASKQRIYEARGRILSFHVISVRYNYIYVISDITESEKVKKQLETLASEDSLTGLYNRRHFMELLENSNGGGTFIIFDLDHFKTINDTYGHMEGDQVLIWFAGKLRECFQNQVACRYGGEEFAVYAENLDGQVAFHKTELLREALHADSSRAVKVTFSAGITNFEKENIPETLIKADQKLYEAKAGGRNQTRYE